MGEIATAYLSIVPETSSIPRLISQAMGEAGRDAEKQGQQVGSRFSAGFGKNVKQLAGLAGITGGVAALAGALRSTLNTGMDFTNSLNTMKAVSGATAQQMSSVSTEARKLGQDSSLAATSSVDAAQAMVELAKGGFSVDQSMKAARGTLQLAAAAQISAADAATIQSQALQSFGKNADYAGKTADILANAANASSAEITDVATALQQGGSVANQFGVSMKDTAATIALLANAGIQGSDAGTLMKSSLIALTDTSERAMTAASDLGFTLDSNGIQFKGMKDLFNTLSGAQERMGDAAFRTATATLFGSDAVRLAGVAAQQGGEGFQKMSDAMDKNGSAADVAKAKMAGLPGAWEQLKNSAEGAALHFYDAIQGPLTQGAKAGADAIDHLVESAKKATPVAQEMFSQITPVVGGATSTLADHRDIALKLAAAYVGLKVVRATSDNLSAGFKNVRSGASAADGATGRFSKALRSVGGAGGTATNAAGSIRELGSAFSQSVTWMRQANPQMSTMAARFSVLRQNGLNAAGGMTAIKGAASGLLGFMGGPLGVALAVGGVALGQYAQHQADAAQRAAEHKAQVDALSESINFNTGALDANGRKQVYEDLNKAGAFKNAKKGGVDVTSEQIQAAGEGQKAALAEVNAQIDAVVRNRVTDVISDRQAQQLKAAGLSIDDYTAALRGNADAQKRFADAGQGRDWRVAAKDLGDTAQAAVELGYALGGSNDKLSEAQQKAREESDALGLMKQHLIDISTQFKGQGKGFSIDVDTQQIAGAEDVLQRIGFTVQSLPNGQVKVTANTDEAAQKLQWITQNVNVLNAIKANPSIDLNKAQFDAKNNEAHGLLAQLDRTAVSPEAGLTIQKLLEGKSVSMSELQVLDKTTANPKVDMLIDKLMQKLGIVNTELDRTARERTVSFRVQMPDGSFASPAYSGDTYSGPGRADGGIDFGRNGQRIAAFASGGMRTLTDPLILPGSGNGQLVQTPAGPAQVAEGETTKEAWIPFAQSKRKRSTSILATVAQAFGYALVPQESLPNSLSGALGAVVGTGVKALAMRSGADRLAKFALGGIRGADDVNRFPRDNGLEGSPYVWGGVHWGDCSGAMSAIARYAVGLDPWGGRFATASEQDALLKMGFQLGSGSSGDLRFGWVNGGPGGGHTAGQLPDGTNVEMGGARGNGQVGGGAAGPDSFPNRAFLPMGPSWSDPGSDQGGWVQRPDGTWEQVAPGAGNYGAIGGSGISGISGSSGGSEDKSLSGRLGGVASAFVSGQVKSLLDVVSANDTPGILGAISEYESQLKQSPSGSTSKSVPKEVREQAKNEYDSAKQQLKQEYDAEKLSRTQEYELQRQAIVNDYTAKKIDKATYEQKLNDLKHQHEADELSKKQSYDAEVDQAKAKYESAIGKTGSGSGADTSGQSLEAKQQYENERLARDQEYDQEKASRKATYDAALKDLQAQRKAKQLSKEQYEAKSAELKAKYDGDLQSLKVKHDNAELEKKQEYDRLSAQLKSQGGSSSPSPSITDPGTQKPAPGQDLGGLVPTTGSAIKDAFRSGLREAWRQGQPWTDTDWIVGRESSWNPNARNGDHFGLGQWDSNAWAAAGKQQTPDPLVQGEVYDNYVSGRYPDPEKARAHWEAKNWYDQGGEAHGIGVMQKNVLKPERVLSPDETQAFQVGMRNGFSGNSADIVERLDRLIRLMTVQPQGAKYYLPNEQSMQRVQKQQERKTRAALAGI